MRALNDVSIPEGDDAEVVGGARRGNSPSEMEAEDGVAGGVRGKEIEGTGG